MKGFSNAMVMEAEYVSYDNSGLISRRSFSTLFTRRRDMISHEENLPQEIYRFLLFMWRTDVSDNFFPM